MQLLYVADPRLVKEMGKSVKLGKPPYLQKERGPLLGKCDILHWIGGKVPNVIADNIYIVESMDSS